MQPAQNTHAYGIEVLRRSRANLAGLGHQLFQLDQLVIDLIFHEIHPAAAAVFETSLTGGIDRYKTHLQCKDLLSSTDCGL